MGTITLYKMKEFFFFISILINMEAAIADLAILKWWWLWLSKGPFWLIFLEWLSWYADKYFSFLICMIVLGKLCHVNWELSSEVQQLQNPNSLFMGLYVYEHPTREDAGPPNIDYFGLDRCQLSICNVMFIPKVHVLFIYFFQLGHSLHYCNVLPSGTCTLGV